MLAHITTDDKDVEPVHSVKHRIKIPSTYEEVVNDPVFGAKSLEASNQEINDLIPNGTFAEVVAPSGANIVTCKWVFNVKYTLSGEVQRFKARLVARGFSQIYGADYEDTFAPSMRMDSLRLLLAIIGIEDWEAHQVDFRNAFTQSDLSETIHMKVPPGMKVPKGKILRLKRSLYVLKHAARDWNIKCAGELINMGFKQSLADPCIFVHHERRVVIGLYVDDMLVAGP